MNWLYTIIATPISAMAYRIGGLGVKDATDAGIPLWLIRIPHFRDAVCTACAVGYMILFGSYVWWLHLIAAVLMFFALTTYWDEIPFQKGVDKFWLHGLMIGLSFIVYDFTDPNIYARAIVMCAVMGIWHGFLERSSIKHKDWFDELGRGFIIASTLPIL